MRKAAENEVGDEYNGKTGPEIYLPGQVAVPRFRYRNGGGRKKRKERTERADNPGNDVLIFRLRRNLVA